MLTSVLAIRCDKKMIEYSKLGDPEYFKSLKEDIARVPDTIILTNLLRSLSFKIADRSIDSKIAEELLGCIRERIDVLTDVRRNNKNRDENYSKTSQKNGRTLSMKPTAVSNKRGNAALVFIIANVAITTVMYTLLLIAHLAK